ncbi:MAG: NAD(P)H-dependent glycerol-3-phosphate dehydrogenase, partial [Saprospiraceae bacterium]|nr:NAD(P)H-dependent glycerol-3-phosphate dehydrogenase [Saprospiraceae bacterium]
QVLLYARKTEVVQAINSKHEHLGVKLAPNVKATNSLAQMAEHCTLIFPIVPSINFREVIKELSTYLRPAHLLIHGTKGLDVAPSWVGHSALRKEEVQTMSQIIVQESDVVRVGCLSGPNLAEEIMKGQPAATVIGSPYQEVIDIGGKVLTSPRFHVSGTYDMLGAEIAGALKNVVAIASGMLKGMGLGKNIQSVLITKGLHEMTTFGEAMGASKDAFLSLAGVGDLFATTTSKKSRNYTFGYRLGAGESKQDILDTSEELAEGTRTAVICQQIANFYQLDVPLFNAIYNVIEKNADKHIAIQALLGIANQQNPLLKLI